MFFVDLSFWPSLFSSLVSMGVGEPAVGSISAFSTPLSFFACCRLRLCLDLLSRP